MRTSFHHQPEAQHPHSPAIYTPAGRLPHLLGHKRTNRPGLKTAVVRSCPITDKLLRCRECPLSAGRLAFDAGVDRSYTSGLERQEENPTVDLSLIHISEPTRQ